MNRRLLVATIICLMTCSVFAGCSKSADNSLADKLENVKEDMTGGSKDEEDEEEEDEADRGEDKSSEEESKDNAPDYEKMYAPVFDEVSDVLINGYDYDRQYDFVSDGLMERVMYPGEEDLLDDVGYILEDISNDGIPELMIGYNDPFDLEGVERSFVLGVYTLSDEKPHTTFSGWARNRYWPLPDGHFYNSGSSGASSTAFGENHLSKDGTEVIWDDFYFSEENSSGEMVFFHNTSGIWDRSESEQMDISERKFWSLMDEYEERCILFSWTPMREHARSGNSSSKSEDHIEFRARDITNNMSSSEMDDIQDKLNSVEYNGFLLSMYTDPRDIYWNEVFYVGAGLDQNNGSQSAKINKAYLKATGEDEIMTDITAVSGKDVKEYVKKTTGFDYSEMRHPLDWVYLEDYDMYAEEHGDTNQMYVQVMAAHYEDGEYAVTYVGTDPYDEKCVIFTKEKDGTYRFIANVSSWFAKDPTNGGDIDQSTITDGMIIPDSDSRKLTDDDLKGFDKEELRIARNEIYARHGRRFSDKKLQEHFEKMEWYFGTIDPEDFDESSLSRTERYNLDLIREYENKVAD